MPFSRHGLSGLVRLHRQFGMGFHQALVAEDGDAGDGVHVLRMQEVDELRQVMECSAVVAPEQRMLEGDGDAAIAVLDIEDHGVAAHFTPVADDANAMIAGRHDSGEVDGPYFKITLHRDRFFDDRLGSSPGMITGWPAFRNVPWKSPLALANRLCQFGRGQVRGLRKIVPRHQRDAVSALGDVRALPGGATAVSDGSGALGASGG